MKLHEQMREYADSSIASDEMQMEQKNVNAQKNWAQSDSNESAEMAYNNDLSYMDKFLQNSTQLPNGKYTMIVDDVWLEKLNHNTHAFRWVLKVIDPGEYNGVRVERQNTLNGSENSAKQMTNDLRTCGISIDSFNELNDPELHKHLIGTQLVVNVTHKSDFSAYYLRKRLPRN